MILHLVNDHQVVERMLEAFEQVFPNGNIVLVFSSLTIKHLERYANCTKVSKHNYLQIASSLDFDKVDVIISHYMSFEKIDFIRQVPSSIPVVWEIYGADLYNQFLEPFGYKVFYSNPYKYQPKLIFRFKHLIKLYRIVRGIPLSTNSSIKRCFDYITSRTQALAGMIEDCRLVERYSNKSFHHIDIFNYSIEVAMGDLCNKGYSFGRNILIGNSASLSNNHLYTLQFIRKLHIKDVNLILQLAYGAPSNRYTKEVISSYSKSFGNIVQPILDYLPLDEYNRTYLSIGTIILSNWRQEAEGTIYLGLFLGIKIFLSNKSPVYKYLKDLDYCIFETEKISQSLLDEPLSNAEKKHNRDLLTKQFNQNRLLSIISQEFSRYIN